MVDIVAKLTMINAPWMPEAKKEIESLRQRIQQISKESDRLKTGIRTAWNERDKLQRQHNELLMEVQQKVPGETRHQTALRILRENQSREMDLQGEAGRDE